MIWRREVSEKESDGFLNWMDESTESDHICSMILMMFSHGEPERGSTLESATLNNIP